LSVNTAGILLSSLQLLSAIPFYGIFPRFFPRLLFTIPFYGFYPWFLSTDSVYGDLSMSGAHPSYPSGLLRVFN